MPPMYFEVQRLLLQNIDDLRREVLIRTEELLSVVSSMDQFTDLPAADPLAHKQEGSIAELGLRLAAEDYSVNMSGNKTSVGSVFTEKKRASVTGRASKEKRNSMSGAPADLLWFRKASAAAAAVGSSEDAKKKSHQSLGRQISVKNVSNNLQSEQQAKVDIIELGGSGLQMPHSGNQSAASLAQMRRVSSHQSNTSNEAHGHEAAFVEIEMEEAGLKMPPQTLFSAHQETEGNEHGLKIPHANTSTKGNEIYKSNNSIETEGLKFPPTASQLSISVTPATLHQTLETTTRDSKADRRIAGSEKRVKSLPVPPPPTDPRRSSGESSKSTERTSTSSGRVGWNMIKATVAFHSALKSVDSRFSSTAEPRASKAEGEHVAVIQEESGHENDGLNSNLPLDAPAKSSMVKRKSSQGSESEEIKQAKAKILNLKSEDQCESLDSLVPTTTTTRAKSENVLHKQPKVTPPQLPISEEFKNWHFTLSFLIPCYDNKGRVIDIDQFERKDIEDAVFSACGLHPRSLFMSYWDFGMSLFHFICIWLVPFCICYQKTLQDYEEAPSINPMINITFSFVCSIVFLCDSVVSVMTPQPIAAYSMCSFRDYELSRQTLNDWTVTLMKKYLIYHFLSTVPWDVIFQTYDWHVYLQILRIFRLYTLPQRLNNCAIYKHLFIRMEKLCGSAFGEIFPICVVMFFVLHINACLMFLMGKWSHFVGWEIIWEEFHGAGVGQFYAWTYYMTVGNMLPMSFMFHTTEEIALGILSMVAGSIMFACFIGSISAATLSFDTSGRLFNQKMDELKDYMKWKNVSDETRQRLITYYETKYRGKYFEEGSLLADMNDSLRTEVSLHNTRRLIEQVPFLRRMEKDGRNEIFYGRIAAALIACYYTPGDYITKQGDSGLEMYFILQGKVNIFIGDVKVTSLYDGAYVGEVALITKALRTATIQAALPSVLYRLNGNDFQKILNDFPDMKVKIDNLARNGGRTLDKMKKISGMGDV
ncbi:Potassium/sodium hyperpolarization-activated cyclic nucleotide-gated channel 2 [Chytriomyces hyalinus]|nr:Potassium/sodium hyperpolarization-activated cyclic nucleotide-gated channel 2 [Chytriomyces hyalinus]